MGLADVNGPNDLVNDALGQIETRIFSDHWVAASSAKTELRLVKERLQAGEDFDVNASVRPVYGRYLDSINRLLRESLGVLVEIGSANPGYVSSNPAQWAYDLLRPYAWGMMRSGERNFLHDYMSLLNDEEETIVSLRTDFCVEIENSLAIAKLSDAVIQLARRGWKQSGGRLSSELVSRSETPLPEPVAGSPITAPATLRFTLADLEDPPKGSPRCDVVRYLYPHLKRAIKEGRAWCNEEGVRGRKPSDEDLVNGFPVLRTANRLELQYISGPKKPHDCAIEIMVGRTSLTFDTITRYLHPM